VLSLIVTVVNEVIATAAELRSTNLKASLTELIDDPVLRQSFYDHGIISGINGATADAKSLFMRFVAWLYRLITRSGPADDTSHISYVSGQMFARAVLGSVDVTKTLPTFDDVKKAIEEMPDSNIRDALLAQLTTVNGDLQLLHENVAAWFDNAMDRVSGVYKRHLKQVSFFVGMVLVLIVNADTLIVTQSLWGDASLRAAMVQSASALLATTKESGGANPAPPSQQTTQTGAASAPQSSGTASLDDRVKAVIREVGKAEQELRPLPLGWNRASMPKEFTWTLLFIFVAKVVGLFLTAIAISLGAPFWFDLLSMFMRVRGTGDKPEKTSAT